MRGSFGARRRGRVIHRLATGWMVVAILTGLLAQASPTWAVGASDAPVDQTAATDPSVPVKPAAPTVTAAGAAPVDLATSGQASAGAAGTRDVPVRQVAAAPAPPAIATEVVAKRTENSRTIALPNGKFRLELSAGRMNYQDAKGAWQRIDLSLQPTSGAYGLSVTALDRDVSFGTGRGSDAIARVAVNGVGSAALRAPDHGLAQLKDAKLIYPADASTPDVQAQPTDRGIEFQGIWQSAGVSNTLELTLDTAGLTPVLCQRPSRSPRFWP